MKPKWHLSMPGRKGGGLVVLSTLNRIALLPGVVLHNSHVAVICSSEPNFAVLIEISSPLYGPRRCFEPFNRQMDVVIVEPYV